MHRDLCIEVFGVRRMPFDAAPLYVLLLFYTLYVLLLMHYTLYVPL